MLNMFVSKPQKLAQYGEVALTYLYRQQPGNLSSMRLQINFNKM
jgi:hypothetical protein